MRDRQRATERLLLTYLHIEIDIVDLTLAIVQIDGQLIERQIVKEMTEVTLQQVFAGPLLDVRRPTEPRHLAR